MFTCVVVEIETSSRLWDLPIPESGELGTQFSTHSVSHSKSSVQSSAPLQLSLYPSLKVSDSAQAVTGWQATISAVEAESVLHFVRAWRWARLPQELRVAVVAVGLPGTTSVSSLRVGPNQTFRAP